MRRKVLMARPPAQMAVELAVIMPVVMAVVVLVAQLSFFVVACARFDRAASQACIAQGVSPAKTQEQQSACPAIEAQLVQAMKGNDLCQVKVEEVDLSRFGLVTPGFTLAPRYKKYLCTLEVRPFMGEVHMGPVHLRNPVVLTHQYWVVVDSYRSGIVVGT